MIVTAELWNKNNSINGRDAGFLSEHFKKQNGNDNRILISYDGIISRIEYVDDCFLNTDERLQVQELIGLGYSKEQALVETWQKKLQKQADEENSDEILSLE